MIDTSDISNECVNAANKAENCPDVLIIMERIRSRIREETASGRKNDLCSNVETRHESLGSARAAGQLQYSEELRYLNNHYGYSSQLDLSRVVSHRTGVVGKAIVAIKRKMLRVLWDSLLKDYFSAEREYQANLVRFLNEVSRYIDARDGATSAELKLKLQNELEKISERFDRLSAGQYSVRRGADEIF